VSEASTRKRVRMVLAAGLLTVIAVLAVELSGSAPRTAGSNHVVPTVFAATVPGGGIVCQPVVPPPGAMSAVRLLIGTYGRPVPPLVIRFLSVAGATVAQGRLAPGAREGDVTVRMRNAAQLSDAASVCVRVGGSSTVVLAGERGPGGTETVNGKPVAGALSLMYVRRGSESWWQLLPTLDTRFGLGKASFFGDWTLPVLAILLLAVWVATARLLVQELR
jgi:hypothetical protein